MPAAKQNLPPGKVTRGALLLDQRKTFGRTRWNQEITSKTGGTIIFRIAALTPVKQVPNLPVFSVNVVTDKGFRELNRGGTKVTEILLAFDCYEPQVEKTVTLPAGLSWFMIDYHVEQEAEIQLQCFEAVASLTLPLQKNEHPAHCPGTHTLLRC